MNDFPAFAYQRIGTEFLLSQERALILADEPGLGKSRMALEALGRRGLVVCPPSLKYNWASQCRLWRSDLRPIVMVGSGLAGFKWPSSGELVIVGYNQLPEWMEMPPAKSGYAPKDKTPSAEARRKELAAKRKALKKQYEQVAESGVADIMMIADEAQYVKNIHASRSRRFRTLSGLVTFTRLLTGTPMPRGNPADLWGILTSANMAETVFDSEPRFKAIAGIASEPHVTPSPEFHRKLSLFMLRRRKTEVAEQLPPKLHQTHIVELDAATTAQLEALSSELVAAIQKARTPMELAKLATLPGFNDFSRARQQIARARIPGLLEYVELAEDNDDRLLVFSAHRDPILALGQREGWAMITGDTPLAERQRIVENQANYKGLAITIKSGGTGLTLTSFSHVVYVDLDWDVTQNEQADDRIHRHGQTADFCLYTILTSRTAIDQLITSKLVAASLNIQIGIDGAVS